MGAMHTFTHMRMQVLAANSAGAVISMAGQLFDRIDVDHDGFINKDEFVPLIEILWKTLGTPVQTAEYRQRVQVACYCSREPVFTLPCPGCSARHPAAIRRNGNR